MILSFKLSYLEKVFMVYVLFSIDYITSSYFRGFCPWSFAWPVELVTVGFFLLPDTPARFARVTLLLHTKPILRKKPTVLQCTFPRFAFISLQERTMEQRGRRPVQPLGFVNITKVIFRPIKRLILITSWFPKKSANFYSVLLGEIVKHSPLQYSALFALRQSRVDLITFQTIY